LDSRVPYDEQELLRRIAAGEEEAFRKMVGIYFNRLTTYILGLTGSRPLTEEITQDVLLKVWQNRLQLQEVVRFDAWLFVIARNRTYDCLTQLARERDRRHQWEQEVLATMQVMEEGSEGSALDRYRQLLEAAVDQLPPQQKLIYKLSREQRLNAKAIREQTGLSIDTIKKHRSRAIKNIKAFLQKFTSLFWL